MLILALLGCPDEPSPQPTDTGTAPVELPQVTAQPPTLPRQLLVGFGADLDALGDVVHEGPDGTSAVLEAVVNEAGEPIGWPAPDGSWAFGTHTVRLDPDIAGWRSDEGPVETLSFTLTDTWSGDGSEHPSWTVDQMALAPSDLGDVVLLLVEELIVVPPTEPDGDWVLLTTEFDCIVYQGPVYTGRDGYELALDTLEIDIGADGPLILEDTQLSFTFASDGSEGVGSARTLADGRGTTDLDEGDGIGPAYVCDPEKNVGALTCHRCDPDDEEALCADLRAPWVHMTPRDEPFDAASLPVCGVDASGYEASPFELQLGPISCDGPDFDIDIDCGCRSVPGRLGLAFVPAVLLWWRRRR